MRFPLLQPRWLGIHLLGIVVMLGCFGLGYWQFVRAQEPSREVITNPVEELAAAVRLETVLEPGEYMGQDRANEAVRVTGTFDPDGQVVVPALSPEGDEGYSVVAPLVTADGAAVAVDRGWLPKAQVGADRVAPAPPGGEVTVTGWLRPPQGENTEGYSAMSVPEGEAERIAPAVLVNTWPYELYDGYVVLGEQAAAEPGGDAGGDGAAESAAAESGLRIVPPPDPPTGITWNARNLSYAAQWAVFGIAAIVFWVSLVRRELADRRAAAESGGATGGADGAQPSVVGAD
ncbi:SURF1 family protein [Marinactinospora rubrisoli]|uniref:SURF1-like protein n=1 Tax=Marinactinospora rubrisoli TaxID=2715399 RepID=A0ABW2K8G6_9ACTN